LNPAGVSTEGIEGNQEVTAFVSFVCFCSKAVPDHPLSFCILAKAAGATAVQDAGASAQALDSATASWTVKNPALNWKVFFAIYALHSVRIAQFVEDF
jgi:hypothetical protein